MPSQKPQSESSGSSIQSVEIANIRMDGGTQPRAKLFEDVVTEYSEDMRQGATFPPVIVFFDGKEYWLADGFHRIRAKEAIGAQEVTADVHLGTQRDAVLYAVGANSAHGLRRTNADKRRAVIRLLHDYEWNKWSDREIARRCGVSNRLVGDIRRELSVSFSQTDSTDNLFDIDPTSRLVIRGGTAFEMDTTNIRNRPEHEEKEKPKRKRTKKQRTTLKPLEVASKEVVGGDIWKLGKSHFLFCGDLSSNDFQSLLPDKVGLFLIFSQTREQHFRAVPENAMNALLFYTSYGEDIDLRSLRQMLESCLSTTTEAGDPVIVVNLPDPLLFIMMEHLFCPCYCAEPDPQRCTEALTAWAAIKQPAKKL